MNAKFERNYGILKLVYGCPKCKSTLTSTRMEIEAGEDECPECRNVVHFPPSLLTKFDAAEHQHQETLKAKTEKRLAKKKENRKESAQFFNGPMGVLVVIVAFFLGLPAGVYGCFVVGDWLYANRTEAQKAAAHSASVSSMISSANNARYDRDLKQMEEVAHVLRKYGAGAREAQVGAAIIQQMDKEREYFRQFEQ